jgi:hypothetical protein
MNLSVTLTSGAVLQRNARLEFNLTELQFERGKATGSKPTSKKKFIIWAQNRRPILLFGELRQLLDWKYNRLKCVGQLIGSQSLTEMSTLHCYRSVLSCNMHVDGRSLFMDLIKELKGIRQQMRRVFAN